MCYGYCIYDWFWKGYIFDWLWMFGFWIFVVLGFGIDEELDGDFDEVYSYDESDLEVIVCSGFYEWGF